MHIKQTHKSDTQLNLLKEHVSQTHGLTEIKNNETPTKCINHWAYSANLKGVTFNKVCGGLKGKCFEMPNASYTNRYGASGMVKGHPLQS